MDFRTGYRPRLRTVSLLRKNRLRMRICVGAAIAVAATASAVTWNGAPSATHAVAAAAAVPAARVAPADTHPAAAKNVRPVYPYSIVPGGVATRADVQQRVDTDQVVAKHYASFDIARAHAMAVAKPRAVHVSYRKGDKVYWTSKTVMLAAGETVLSDGASEIRGRCGNRISDKAMLPVAMNEPTEQELDAASMSAGDQDGGSLENASFAPDDAAPSLSGNANGSQLLAAAATGQDDAAPASPYDRADMPAMPVYSNGISRAMGMQPSLFLAVSSGPADALVPTTEASATAAPDVSASAPSQTIASAQATGSTAPSGSGMLPGSTAGSPVGASTPATLSDIVSGRADVAFVTPSAPVTSIVPAASVPVPVALPLTAVQAADIPEPGSLWLSGIAFAAMLLAGRRKTRRSKD
jgi:hypothetical protein